MDILWWVVAVILGLAMIGLFIGILSDVLGFIVLIFAAIGAFVVSLFKGLFGKSKRRED